MSRIGKKPITVPSGVKIAIGEELRVEGPKGTLSVPIPQGIRFEQNDGTLNVVRDNDSYAAAHGLTRALAWNAVNGVSNGFHARTRYRRNRLPRGPEGEELRSLRSAIPTPSSFCFRRGST